MEHFELNRDLGTIQNELNPVRTKWYNIGVQLKISVDKLDCIKSENIENGNCLREMLKEWLKHHPHPVWRDIANALRSGAVDECKLAEGIGKKYYSDDTQMLISWAEQVDSRVLNAAAHSPPSMEAQSTPEEDNSISVQEDLKRESDHSCSESTLSDETHSLKRGFKCGCGQCSFSSWLEIGCPYASEQNMKYPYLDLDKFSYKDRVALMTKLNDECKQIQRKFSKLVYRTQGSLIEQQISVKQLASCLSDLGTYEAVLPNKPVLFHCLEDIRKAKGVEDLVVKVGKSESETELCMSELLSYQETVSKLLGLKTAALLLRHITKGCVQLTYQIPKFVVTDGEIFPLNTKQMVDLQANGITKLKCENFDWECEPEIVEETEVLDSANGASTKQPQETQLRSYRCPEKNQRATKKNVGIVIRDFRGIFGDELSLTIGERLEIISKNTGVSRNLGWWTGRNEKGRIGIFPSACVKVISDSTNVSLKHELLMEILYKDIELKEVIGVGGFGKVHRAIYRQEEVAVKVVKYATIDSFIEVQEVIAEAEIFAHLAHINICALVGVVLVKDVCLVTEYARGGALSEVLHKKRISLPLDIILDWATQIAAGMMYLHHEAQPSFFHRDLKSSNILLLNVVNPDNLYGNIVKITDFALAREIVDTMDMSGAGTYPWMAPEVIRSHMFSKKSDVWSYAVVFWELLTGEWPYSGLNLFVVAYGVGHGTLSLPIPVGCPEPLSKLMKACWMRTHNDRPSFIDVHALLQSMENYSFFSSTTVQDFQTIQSSWKEEIHRKFAGLKEIEAELQAREEGLREKMEKKTKELQERKAAIEKKEMDLQTQTELLQRKTRELEEKDEYKRPPRLKKFSIRRLIRWLSGPGEEQKRLGTGGRPKTGTEDLLPNQMKRPTKRTIGYFGSPSESGKRTTPDNAQSLPNSYTLSVTTSGGNVSRVQCSDDLPVGVSKEQLQRIDNATAQFQRWRAYSPSPTSRSIESRPVPAILRGVQDEARSHSITDPRSPSPQQIPHLSPPRSPRSRPCATGSTFAPVMATPMHPDPSTVPKPTHLSFHRGKTLSSVDSSPSSPTMTVTSVEGYSIQCDSGRGSMTSDDSEHSNHSENHQDLIKLESPTSTNAPKAMFHILAEFDPLQGSYDNLLYDSYIGITSSNCSPNANSSSPQSQLLMSAPPNTPRHGQISPKLSPQQSLTLETPISGPSLSIVRPRPRPSARLSTQGDLYHPISAPSSRPQNLPAQPLHHHQRTSTSPTDSVHSFGFQSDSDYISNTSSLPNSDSSNTSSLWDLADINVPNPPNTLPGHQATSLPKGGHPHRHGEQHP